MTQDAPGVAQEGTQGTGRFDRPDSPSGTRGPLQCHPGRAHYAKGLCQRCYWKVWNAANPRQKALPLEPEVQLVQRIGVTPRDIARAQKPQTIRVLAMLQAAGVLGCTTGDFLRAGIGRFGARVAELRAVGHVIQTVKLTDSSALYALEPP